MSFLLSIVYQEVCQHRRHHIMPVSIARPRFPLMGTGWLSEHISLAVFGGREEGRAIGITQEADGRRPPTL